MNLNIILYDYMNFFKIKLNLLFFNTKMSFTSQQLDEVVEKLFHKYDKDKNQYLDQQ